MGDVLVLANQLAFLDRSGGIGSAHRNLVIMLAAAGIRVRVVYARQYSKALPSSNHDDSALSATAAWLGSQGIQMVVLPALGIGAGDAPEATAELASSAALLWWMQRQEIAENLES